MKGLLIYISIFVLSSCLLFCEEKSSTSMQKVNYNEIQFNLDTAIWVKQKIEDYGKFDVGLSYSQKDNCIFLVSKGLFLVDVPNLEGAKLVYVEFLKKFNIEIYSTKNLFINNQEFVMIDFKPKEGKDFKLETLLFTTLDSLNFYYFGLKYNDYKFVENDLMLIINSIKWDKKPN
jgi:hypothetical protein